MLDRLTQGPDLAQWLEPELHKLTYSKLIDLLVFKKSDLKKDDYLINFICWSGQLIGV